MPDATDILLGINASLFAVLGGLVLNAKGESNKRFTSLEARQESIATAVDGKLKDLALGMEKRFESLTLTMEKRHDSLQAETLVLKTTCATLKAEVKELRDWRHQQAGQANQVQLAWFLERTKNKKEPPPQESGDEEP